VIGMPGSTVHARHLASTAFIDSEHPGVRAFAQRHAVGVDASQRAVALYRAVRDGFRYDPHQRHGYTEMWLGGSWRRAAPAGAFDADVRRENAGGAEGSHKVRA